jgi:hypothetical protein
MSWSVSAVGKPAAVAAKLAKDFAAIKCSEPEESIKSSVAQAVASALAAFPPNLAVTVSASGSQYAPDSTKPEEKQNQLSVKLDPLYGFIE